MAVSIHSNLDFEISAQIRKAADVDEMLKDIVEKRKLYEGLSKMAKDHCRDRFVQTMAVNFVLQSNKANCADTHTLDGTRMVLEKYLPSYEDLAASQQVDRQVPQTNEYSALSEVDRKYVNSFKALRNSFYGPIDDPENEWSELRGSGLLTVKVVCDLHATLLEGLNDNDGGKIRKRDLKSGRGDVETDYGGETHHYPPPESVEGGFYGIIDRHYIHMEGREKGEISLKQTSYVFKCAAWLLFKLVSLHPFFDGNGRLCRILANYVLSLITPFAVSVYNAKSSDRNRDNYLRAIVHGRENPEKGPAELASMLVEGAYLGWRDLFQYLEVGGLLGSKQLIGPIVVQKSRKTEIEGKVKRLKDISEMQQVLADVQEAVESADTSNLKEPDQHILKEIKVKCGDNIMLLQIEIYS